MVDEDATDNIKQAMKKLNELKKLFQERIDILTGTDKIMDIS